MWIYIVHTMIFICMASQTNCYHWCSSSFFFYFFFSFILFAHRRSAHINKCSWHKAHKETERIDSRILQFHLAIGMVWLVSFITKSELIYTLNHVNIQWNYPQNTAHFSIAKLTKQTLIILFIWHIVNWYQSECVIIFFKKEKKFLLFHLRHYKYI